MHLVQYITGFHAKYSMPIFFVTYIYRASVQNIPWGMHIPSKCIMLSQVAQHTMHSILHSVIPSPLWTSILKSSYIACYKQLLETIANACTYVHAWLLLHNRTNVINCKLYKANISMILLFYFHPCIYIQMRLLHNMHACDCLCKNPPCTTHTHPILQLWQPSYNFKCI